MFNSLFKLGIWLVVGIGSTVAILGNTEFQTPWQYTVDSTIAPGTQITLTQPDGEPVTMEVTEGQTVSGRKTFDVGAPVTMAGFYLLGSIIAFGLKSKRCIHTS